MPASIISNVAILMLAQGPREHHQLAMGKQASEAAHVTGFSCFSSLTLTAGQPWLEHPAGTKRADVSLTA